MQPPALPKFSRLIIAVYFFAAPASLMIADSLHYFHHYLIAIVIFKTSLVLFVVGSFGQAYMLPDKSRYFGLVGTGLVTLGAITISAMSTATLFQDLLADQGYNFRQIKEVEQVLQSTNAMKVIYLPSGFGFPIGLVVLAIGIYQTPYTPRSISILLCIGALFHTVARFVNTLTLLLLSEAVLVIAFSLTGWFMWRYKPAQKKYENTLRRA